MAKPDKSTAKNLELERFTSPEDLAHELEGSRMLIRIWMHGRALGTFMPEQGDDDVPQKYRHLLRLLPGEGPKPQDVFGTGNIVDEEGLEEGLREAKTAWQARLEKQLNSDD